ncbi:MAG: hypothetical protein IJ914_02835 [Prevotella sp.]|nr:hypothetical protein [Prevotella sp.]
MKKEYIIPNITIAKISAITLTVTSLTETLKKDVVDDNTEGFTQQARGGFMLWEDEEVE